MHYLVIGGGKDILDEDMSFEWVIDANSKNDAVEDAKKDMSDKEEILEIKELSVEECVERENENIKEEIERQYLINHYDYENLPVCQYNEIRQDFKFSKEKYYEALKEATKSLRLLRRLGRLTYVDNMTVKDLRSELNTLMLAKTENEMADVFEEIINKYGRK